MKVLCTSFVNGSRRTMTQVVIETSHTNLVAFVDEHLQLDESIVTDQYTTVNDHGVYLNDGSECVESYTIVS